MGLQIKDIFSRLYKLVFDIVFYSCIIATILALLPDHLFTNFPIKPIKYSNEHLVKGLNGLKWNNDLVTKAKIIGSGSLHGPESLTVIGDFLYTGLADGRLVRVHKTTEAIEEILRFSDSKQCEEGVTNRVEECGRWLGLRHHPDGYLYVLETSSGLYRVNVTTKTKEYLTNKVNRKDTAIYNDFVFDPAQEGLVYISISSGRWNLEQIAYAIMEHDQSGYIVAYDLKTGKSVQVSTGHNLTNGIEISADKKYLLFAETTSYSVKRIELDKVRQSFKSGKPISVEHIELFGQHLPGEPDNLRLDETTGDLLVGMFTSRPDGKLFRDYLCNWPFIRKALSRTVYSLSLVLNYIDTNLYKNHAIQQLSYDLYSGHFIYKALPLRDGAVIKLDGKTGQIKQILGSSQFFGVSEAIVDNDGDLYYGSFRNTFLGRIPKGSH